ncbi:MAG: Gfo/Idh/MocA family oxidoreductase, partial [Anaerolineaceae bacterium]
IIGLGLLGLLTAGIAHAAGCAVSGFDLDPRRVELLRSMGMTASLRENAESLGGAFTHGRGFDAVLITADSRSDDPVNLAGTLARDRGRVIAVGAVGLNIPRKVYYEKELSFLVSRSYGPGRYDVEYEERGHDYPIGYVRWTEGRNLQSFIDLLAAKKLDVHPLITHSFSIDQADQAYELISHNQNKESILGVLLTYPQETLLTRRIDNPPVSSASKPVAGQLSLGVLGAGNYATAIFLPVIQKAGGISLAGVVSSSGLSARHAAQRFGFAFSSSSEQDVLENPEINVVTILTRHNSHARQVLAALRLGKHVYCEKPLAIHPDELAEIAAFLHSDEHPVLTVGFNRRFAPMAIQLKEFLGERIEPLVAHYRVNAGYLPLNHWLHAPEVGGGRIIGEGCHFVDFLTFLVGAPPISVSAQALPDNGRYQQDNFVLTLSFSDGSIGSLHYLANGDKSFAKERVEVFCGGQAAALDDFRTLELVKNGSRKVTHAPLRQDKGHRHAWEVFLSAVRQGGEPPIPYTHLLGVTQATFAATAALKEGHQEPVPVTIP